MGMVIAGLSALQSTQMDTVPAHAPRNLYLGHPDQVDEQIVKGPCGIADDQCNRILPSYGKAIYPPAP